MKIVSKELNPLHQQITVTLTPEDYTPKLNSELSKFQNKGQFKGFRKGKAPISLVKKMYGQELLSDILLKKVQEDLTTYLQESKLQILGQAMPSETQERLVIDVHSDKEYAFDFEVGLAPEINLDAVSEDAEYLVYETVVDEDEISEDMDNLHERSETLLDSTEPISTEDFIILGCTKLDENGEIKEGASEISEDLPFDKHSDAVREVILGKTVGFEHVFTTEELGYGNEESEDSESGENKNVKNRCRITSVQRMQRPEINEEYYMSKFGPEIKTEEAAREQMGKFLKTKFDNKADSILFKNIYNRLLEDNKLEFPEEFLKKWLLYNNPDAKVEEIEEEFPKFIDNLTWSLITQKIKQRHEISVTKQELANGFYADMMGYFGGQEIPRELIDSMMKRFMENEDEVSRMESKLSDEKMFFKLKEVVKLEKKEATVSFISEEAEKLLDY